MYSRFCRGKQGGQILCLLHWNVCRIERGCSPKLSASRTCDSTRTSKVSKAVRFWGHGMGCLLEAIAAVCVAKVVDHLVVDDVLAVGSGMVSVHATFRRRRSTRDNPVGREDVRGALRAQSLAVALRHNRSSVVCLVYVGRVQILLLPCTRRAAEGK